MFKCDVRRQECARGLEVVPVRVDDGDARGRNQIAQDQRRPRKQAAANNSNVLDGGKPAQQTRDGTTMAADHEALKRRRMQHEALEPVEAEGIEPAEERRPATRPRAG
jgi:hypothetical protein